MGKAKTRIAVAYSDAEQGEIVDGRIVGAQPAQHGCQLLYGFAVV